MAQRYGIDKSTVSPRDRVAGFLVASAAVVLLSVAAHAQQATPAPGSPTRPTGTVTAKASQPKAAPKPEGAAATPAATASEAGLRQRVEQLEEQLVEMQVTVGTLDSLAKGGGSSSSGVYRGGGNDGAAGAGGDPGRVAALETQVRALATQVDQLTQQIRQLNARGPSGQQSVPVAVVPTVPAPGTATLPPVAAARTQDAADPIGRLVSNGAPATASSDTGTSLPPSAASDASSKQAYENAYGFLLQQDFASAESAFDEFLKRYPGDPLAGNAQYWLGETYFARGQFKPAANAFLKGYQTYGRSAKAPDSVLKLAMSLDKLGQKDAACASYAELNSKFPNAPGHVKNRADTERRRLGCA